MEMKAGCRQCLLVCYAADLEELHHLELELVTRREVSMPAL
jgi:hypothetical protein